MLVVSFVSLVIHKRLTISSLGSCHVTFHSSLAVQSYARHLNISYGAIIQQLLAYTVLIPKDLVGLLLINPLKIWTPTWTHTAKKKKPNKHPILIRLGIINTINTFFNIQVFHKMCLNCKLQIFLIKRKKVFSNKMV